MMRRRPSPVRSCLVDTSAYFALADADDANHQLCRDLLTLLVRARVRVYTTNYVIAETHALLLNRLHRMLASTFVRQIYASDTTIVRASQMDEDRAWAIIATYDDKDFSFADSTSFAVMERLRITHALTLDSDFRQFGFPALAPEYF